MDKVIIKIREISKKYSDIKKVVLFGSRARGDADESSDYDIAVFGAGEETKLRFTDEIEEISTLHKIDLLFLEKRHRGTDIYNNILKEGVEIVNKFEIKLGNYKKAVNRLREALDIIQGSNFEIIRDGIIKRFEFATELSWKTAREYLLLEGEVNINSPKSTMKAAYRIGLISNESGWLGILDDRNLTVHIYDEHEANEIFCRIRDKHIGLFEELLKRFELS